MSRGRPSKLTPEAIEKAIEYVEGGYAAHGDLIPSLAGMAVVLGVAKRTIYQWDTDQPDKFSHILAKCNATQESILLRGGLSGEMNSNIVKLVLGKHGYHDRQELTGKDGGPVETKSAVIAGEMSAEEATSLYLDMLGED